MADRAYAPWIDLGDKMLKENIPLSAIESKKPLKEFDCLGFTLQTELIYTNILYMLELAQLPLRCDDRNQEHPIIIAGGINAINPHPLSLFIDAFVLGEAEEGILQINEIFLKETDKNMRLKLLSELSFVYVPRPPFSPHIHGKDRMGTVTNTALKYTSFPDSEETHYPQLVPLLEGTHNRYTAEIMRGCTRGCRFCQAGMFYRPTREKQPEIIIKQLLNDTHSSGWDSCGLMSLSSSDYSQIKPLLNELIHHLKDSGTSVSLPSLRIDSIDTNITELMNHLKKSGITLAPEAGTQRLRDIINKNLTEDEILDAVKCSFEADVKLIKLYFMIGLPFETDDDIEGIISLIEKIIDQTKRKMRINVSISPFVPKPMTPFQWAKMESENDLLGKALKIKHSFMKYKFVKINYHTIELSFLEAVLGRGDRDTGYVLEKAYQTGARFDSWREHFDYSLWQKAAEFVGYDWYKSVRGYDLDSELPWDNIDVGVTKEYLKSEYIKAEKGITTPDCRDGVCSRCGACREGIRPFYVSSVEKHHSHPHIACGVGEMNDLVILEKVLYRIYFSKMSDLKYLSHLDFLRLIHRLLMLSGLPIVFSQGFNPHPKTSFCPPLSSGIEGENEFFDVWMSYLVSSETVLEKLSKLNIGDLNFHKVELLFESDKYKSSYIPISEFEIESIVVEFLSIKKEEIDLKEKRLNSFLFGNDTIIQKEKKGVLKQINLNDIIQKIYFKDGKLFVVKKIQGASIFDILKKIFDIDRDQVGSLRIVRRHL